MRCEMLDVPVYQRQEIINCACGGVIAVQLDDENLEIRHQGRKMHFAGEGVVTITHEQCGRTRLVRLDKPQVVALA